MKLAVLGGGGVRAIYLARSIVKSAKKLGFNHIVFMDNNPRKLKIFGTMAKQVAKAIDPNLKFELTDSALFAVTDADYVITTLRVGEDAGRVIDERVALNNGVLGQETTGAGGFAMALRSIPALLEYCKLIKEHAKPGAIVFNFTNPSGLVSQALRNAGYDNVFGICDGPSGFAHHMQQILKVKPEQFSMRCYGLNHLSWFDQIRIDGGEDITQKLINDEHFMSESHMNLFDKKLVELNGNVLLNEYLYYFFYREKAVASILSSDKTRGETIRDINLDMIADLETIDIENDMAKAFAVYMEHQVKRHYTYMSIEAKMKPGIPQIPTFAEFVAEEDEGGYAGVALNFIRIKSGGKPGDMVLMVPNTGAINGFADDDVVEISCTIDKDGVHPQKIGDLQPLQLNLMRQVKFYERYAVEAILEKNRDKAILALLMHPLVNSYSLAKILVDSYLEQHKAFVGDWQ